MLKHGTPFRRISYWKRLRIDQVTVPREIRGVRHFQYTEPIALAPDALYATPDKFSE